MWRSSSGEHSRAIDKLPEDKMLFHTIESVQAEIAYRQERIKQDFQRPGWFQRKPAAAPRQALQQTCVPAVQARHAM